MVLAFVSARVHFPIRAWIGMSFFEFVRAGPAKLGEN